MRLHVQQTGSTVTYDSLKSRLDSTIDYKYYDNLNSPSTNFYYGTITKEAYEMSVKLYKLDDYEQCPGLTPYATKDMQSCMACPPEKPLFNLGTYLLIYQEPENANNAKLMLVQSAMLFSTSPLHPKVQIIQIKQSQILRILHLTLSLQQERT